tara:strand:- start:503 stop:964 length:462 start_codon:yes stop_codon:yes gene_type:complete
MADLSTVQKLATELQVLKNEVNQVASVNEKLDSAIDKLTDISASIKSMLAVHEEKISKTEEVDKAIFNLLESRRIEHDNKYEELHARINKIHRQITDEIEMSEKRLMSEIKTLNADLDGRIGVFEKYRWIIVGAAIVIGLSMPSILELAEILQ